MPQFRGFNASIIRLREGEEFPKVTQRYSETVAEKDGNSARTVIGVGTGDVFACWWYPVGTKLKRKKSYSAEFLRDGESVVHLLFTREVLEGGIEGGVTASWESNDGKSEWEFYFSRLECVGKEDGSKVPAEIGKLELIIRSLSNGETNEQVGGSSSERSEDSDDDDSEESENSNWEDDEDSSENDYGNSSEDDSEDDYKGRREDDLKVLKSMSQHPRKKRCGGRRNPNQMTQELDYSESKPYQTHTADMRPIGTWSSRYIKPIKSKINETRRPIEDMTNVIVHFIFEYTSTNLWRERNEQSAEEGKKEEELIIEPEQGAERTRVEPHKRSNSMVEADKDERTQRVLAAKWRRLAEKRERIAAEERELDETVAQGVRLGDRTFPIDIDDSDMEIDMPAGAKKEAKKEEKQ